MRASKLVKIHFEGKPIYEIKIKIALMLEQARERKGLTQTQLAKIMKVSQPDVGRAESGLHLVSLAYMHKVANALGRKLKLPEII